MAITYCNVFFCHAFEIDQRGISDFFFSYVVSQDCLSVKLCFETFFTLILVKCTKKHLTNPKLSWPRL